MENKVGRWDYEKHNYDPITFPDNWLCTFTGRDLLMKINCANCGEEHLIEDMYTSCEIHEQNYGFGYLVCGACSDKEWERRRKYRDD